MRAARRQVGWRAALGVVLLSLAPERALAQDDPAPLPVKVGASAGMVTTSFDITSAFTETFRRKLGGGLTSRVLIELELFDGKNESIGTAVRACQLRLDVWDDVLFVGVTDEQATRRTRFSLTDDALRACGRVEELPLAERSRLSEPGGYRLVVRVALNPISPEVLERTREFMANPRGSGGRPRAFFGAVAKLFRSDSTAGGERFIFQSPPLARP